MQMPAVMEKRWLAVVRLASRSLAINADGVSLGKTLLAPFRGGELVIDKARITAMLSVAYDREVPFKTQSLRHAERCYKNGNVAMAQMHLALCGLPAIDLGQAQRLFIAEWALANHVPPRELLKIAGIGKFNPNHLGPGPGGGEFTSAGRNGASNGMPPGAGKPMRTQVSSARASANSAIAASNDAGRRVGTLGEIMTHDDAIDSDPIGGVFIPAAGAFVAIELAEPLIQGALEADNTVVAQEAEIDSQATSHAVKRMGERDISLEDLKDAMRSAREEGEITLKLGKYGTPQVMYKGKNGITAVVETSGRNAGKVISAWRKR